MKRHFCYLFAIVVVSILSVGGYAWGGNAKAGLAVKSAYVWRGQTLTDGMVLQPQLDVVMGGFGVNLWGNTDAEEIDEVPEEGLVTEIDIELAYAFNVDLMKWKIGFIDYALRAMGADTREVFVSMVWREDLGFVLGGSLFYDVDEINDFYADFQAGYAFMLGELESEVIAEVGLAGGDASAGEDGGLNQFSLEFDLLYRARSAMEFGANFMYVNSIDEKVLPEQSVDFVMGIRMAKKF